MNNTKPKRDAAVLVLVVFALGVLLGAFGNHVWGAGVWGKPPARRGVAAELTSELNLNADQQKKFNAIMDDTQSQLRTLYGPANAQCHAIYAPLDPQHDQIRQRSRDRIRAVLTADQRAKFDAFMSKLDERRKKQNSR